MLSARPPTQAIGVGHEAIRGQCAAIAEWAAAVGKPTRTDFPAPSTELDARIEVGRHSFSGLRVGGWTLNPRLR